MKTHNLALFLVAGVTIASTIFAVTQGIIPDASVLLEREKGTSKGDSTLSSIISKLDIFNTKEGEVAGVDNIGSLYDQEKYLAFADLAKGLQYEPKRFTYLDQNIEIETVGLTLDGTLEAPKSWFTAGWYDQSSKVGEEGNVIIDGHFDTNTGTPGAFWALKNLKVNDTVILRDTMDKDFEYKVRSVFYVDIQDPDRTLIFEDTNKPELTLITCGGVWNTAKHTYDKRLIVKADLVSSNTR